MGPGYGGDAGMRDMVEMPVLRGEVGGGGTIWIYERSDKGMMDGVSVAIW